MYFFFIKHTAHRGGNNINTNEQGFFKKKKKKKGGSENQWWYSVMALRKRTFIYVLCLFTLLIVIFKEQMQMLRNKPIKEKRIDYDVRVAINKTRITN